MKVTCDKCHKDFNILLKEEEKHIDNEFIIKTYFECPECKTRYDMCYDNKSTLALKKQINKHKHVLNTLRNEKEIEKQIKIIKKKQKRLETETKILQTKYHKHFEK